MIPNLRQTYQAVIDGMTDAQGDAEFGGRLLLSGKLSGLVGQRRETWLCTKIAAAFEKMGFNAVAERHKRIDLAIFDTVQRLTCAIEVKFYYCHACTRTGHPHLCNTWHDLLKRRKHGVAQQAIALAGDYLEMPDDGDAAKLYQARRIRAILNRGAIGFSRFESLLFKEFSPICDIVPLAGDLVAPGTSWLAAHKGATMRVRGWVLELRPGVVESILVDGLKNAAGEKDFRRRMEKLERRGRTSAVADVN